jgi:hypothetical protein
MIEMNTESIGQNGKPLREKEKQKEIGDYSKCPGADPLVQRE